MTEYEAVRDGGAGLIDLSATRGRIRVSGSEATMFLNGLITNDVKNLAQNRWMPAVFPTVQGRLIGSVRAIRVGEAEFLIDTEMASMLDLEHSYRASAQIISAVDAMLNELFQAVR